MTISLGYWGLLFEAALVVFAIRAHRTTRTAMSRFILAAIICYTLAASSWFTFYFAAGFLEKPAATSPQAQHTVAHLRYYSDHVLHFLFMAFMIAALISIVREHSTSRTPSV
jgi:hypothetical protein